MVDFLKDIGLMSVLASLQIELLFKIVIVL